MMIDGRRQAPETPAERTPLLVIGGFLGAGKTTLLNRILRSGRRYAVLVNDYGEINIDASLIRSHDGLTIRLENGCICCSLANGLAAALERVLDVSPRPDAIVVETSGVGDPWRVAEFALIEPTLRLEAVLGLVDTPAFLGQLGDAMIGDSVERQLLRCDLILLNKVDRVNGAVLDAVQERIRALMPDARLLPTAFAAVDDDVISPVQYNEFVAGSRCGQRDSATESHALFHAWNFRADRPLDRVRLEAALACLPVQVLRLKGFCRLRGEHGSWLVQVVGRRWQISPFSAGGGALPAETMLTAIATELPEAQERLQRIFEDVIA